MALSADLLVGLGTALIVALLVAILAAVDPSIRRKVSVIRKNGHIESVWVNKRNLVSHGGAGWGTSAGRNTSGPNASPGRGTPPRSYSSMRTGPPSWTTRPASWGRP